MRSRSLQYEKLLDLSRKPLLNKCLNLLLKLFHGTEVHLEVVLLEEFIEELLVELGRRWMVDD